MKNSSKIKAVILAAAMLLSSVSLFSCAESSTTEDENKAAPSGDEVVVTEEEEERSTADIVRENYSGHDYEGYEFTILSIEAGNHWYNMISPVANEVWFEEMTGDSYTDAVFTRNIQTEDLLNIKIVPEWGGGDDNILATVKKLVTAGDEHIDISMCHLANTNKLGIDNYVYNLMKVNTLDISAPWWDENIYKNYCYKGQVMFAITGDYFIFDDFAVPTIFYNKKVVEDYNLEAPNELVRSGDWTLDKMMEQAETFAHDLDGDGVMKPEYDCFGYMDNTDLMKHLPCGCGMGNTYLDEEGIPQIACLTEIYVNSVQKVYNLVAKSFATYLGSNSLCDTMIIENRGLYYYNLLATVFSFREMEADFSILPNPKYDASQDGYYALNNPIWCSTFNIPVTNSDIDRTGIVMDTMCGFSTDTVNRALYEVTLGAKLMRDEESIVMLDYVLASKFYDWGEGSDWFGSLSSSLTGLNNAADFNFVSKMEKGMKACQKGMDKLLEKYEAMLEN